MNVPMLDLVVQYKPLENNIKEIVDDVFLSKKFINGPEVTKLEKILAEYCHCKYAVGVSSGTDALLISLMALDIGYGDEVITTPFTFFATAGSIFRVGAKPVFVDIDPKTYNINPELIEEKINENTKAIIPVHIFGQCAEMDIINDIAQKYNLNVIEDAAQAIGSEYWGRRAGSLGDVGCFSFYPSKNLGACGDGGIVTTNDETLMDRLKAFRQHGSTSSYIHKFVGGNFRLDTIQAAVLLEKFPYLEEWHKGRQKNADYYNEHLKDVVITPYVESYNRMIYNQYTIRTPKRDELQDKLNESNIGNAIYYPVPLHLQECFAYLGYKAGALPESEKAANEVLSIPIYPELTNEQKDYVIQSIKKCIK
ncbi:DegT/DnrJ/EryC1/StrS family aminotransferase [Candidatus Woesearchaeota archaeon]|nr:DegT/DnrJ/EryC1/StrS family aminotransferase [Candidatus Woesearchaeota archaeon]